ncbi:hypothetical protein [Pseudoduganella chitinolytica]|uniref:Uncharacterized protein n=1 Tax=Pseudoduganella chitinolytica TaxID=34070 RepID=A0ABY8BDM6_9BURK|nr:hypothetical protein [Pseudoduganella chitinolytica]WEF34017.1 hypothetical protein PX653_04375 [Pseudoduganella chitinolytica]
MGRNFCATAGSNLDDIEREAGMAHATVGAEQEPVAQVAFGGGRDGHRPRREAGCPRVALAAVALAVAGTTALLAPCLRAAGLETVAAIGAAGLAAVFAVVLVIVSISVLAAPAAPGRPCRPRGHGTAGGARLAGPAVAGQRTRAGGGASTGILSASGRCWPSGRAPP